MTMIFRDAKRALAILIFAGPFFVRFLQTGISAFYRGASAGAKRASHGFLRPNQSKARL